MTKFTKIKVQNYKSITEAELRYTKGVWNVEGDNNDAVFKSNGAGKSTILEAIQQGLFNKNSKGITIEDTYNRLTKRPYRITIYFTIDNDSYVVDNNREDNSYTITKNSIDISKKGINENIKEVQRIIGLDFSTFCAITYISHHTVLQMLDSFSSNNLMKLLLDFDSISNFELKVKDAFNKSKGNVQYLLQENSQLESTASLMAEFKYTDLTPLYKLKQDLNTQLFADTTRIGLDDIISKINTASNKLIEVDKKLSDAIAKRDSSVCPTCGATSNGNISKALLQIEISDLEAQQKELQLEILNLTIVQDEASDELTKIRNEYRTKLDSVDNQITIGEYKNRLYEDNKDTINGISTKLANNKVTLSNEYFNQDLYDTLLKTIKAGKLHKDLLENFTKILNTYIDDYMKYMSIGYLNVKTKALKSSIEFVVYDSRSASFVDINTLSGGELTRVRIVVLMSMLKTIATITSMSTNILILDEALDTLDKSASTDLSNLFQYLIDTEDKFIALVSHGEQLNEIDFTGVIKAVKINNSTTISQG